MANTYAQTILQEARSFVIPSMEEEFERRKEITQVFDLFNKGVPFTVLNLAALKKSELQPTSAIIKIRNDYPDHTEKSCIPVGGTGGSLKVPLTWLQKGKSISHNYKQFANNDLQPAESLAYNLMEMELSFWYGTTGFDSLLIAFLEANRTQVNALSTRAGQNTWKGSPQFYVESAFTDKDRFYNYLISEMQLNNYSGLLDEVANTMWGAEVGYQSQQGPANNVNLSFQYPATLTRYVSNLINVPSGYFKSVHFIVPRGGTGMLTWNDPLNKEGVKNQEGEWTLYESRVRPGIFFDLFIKDGCADTTADGGGKQDRQLTLEFTLNYALFKQPMSVAGETPIFKYMMLNS